MGKYGDIHYLLDRPEPSNIFLEARQIAGFQLQEQFKIYNKEQEISSSNQGFKWVKTELTYPSFSHLTFAFKNKIFAIVIELIDNSGSTFNKQQQENLLNACSENNLIPCLFKINVKENPNWLIIDGDDDIELKPIEKGWNLYDANNNEKIIPVNLSTEEPTLMSNWELSNYAIQVVISDLEKTSNQILSFCDLLEINPQIWFKDKDGNVGWVIVKCHHPNFNYELEDWMGIQNNIKSLMPFNGYFASVKFESMNSKSTSILLRGEQFHVDYDGLKRIYTTT
jgi:hypothetical protein